jgi:predicted HD phosphohydrolase
MRSEGIGNATETVSFAEMKHGTKEDYLLLREHEKSFNAATAERVLRELKSQQDDTLTGYKVSRLEHSLQSATRAHRDGADIDWVVAALLHDIGDGLAPQNHDKLAAEVVRPFLREECTWVVENHAAFQMVYYGHHYGWNRYEREKYRSSAYYQSAVDFCERWDQCSFDPDYRSEPLAFFAPMVRELFTRKTYEPAILRTGLVLGLTGREAA